MSNGVRFGSLHHGRQRCSRVVGAAGLCGGCGGEPPLMVSIFRVLERRAMLDALMSRSAAICMHPCCLWIKVLVLIEVDVTAPVSKLIGVVGVSQH